MVTRGLLLSACAVALVAVPVVGRAQNLEPHQRGLALTAGLTALPVAFQWSCGGALGLELGAAALYRVRQWVILQADTRYNKQIMQSACLSLLRQTDTTYDRSLSQDGFASSTFRVGVETPPTLPIVLLRATAGAGFTWSHPVLPVAVFSVGLGAHNRGVRFLAEWERMQTRTHATSYTWSTSAKERIVVHPTWYSLRFGFEAPLNIGSTPSDSARSP